MGLGSLRSVGGGHGDADIILGELVALEHLGPVESKELHDGLAGVAHGLTEPTARIDRPVQADGGKERTKEELGTEMTVLVEQGHPTAGLLLDLGHGLVVQEVGQDHLVVTHAVAEAKVRRDGYALRRLGVEASALVGADVRLEADIVVFVGSGQARQEEKEEEEEGA